MMLCAHRYDCNQHVVHILTKNDDIKNKQQNSNNFQQTVKSVLL